MNQPTITQKQLIQHGGPEYIPHPAPTPAEQRHLHLLLTAVQPDPLCDTIGRYPNRRAALIWTAVYGGAP